MPNVGSAVGGIGPVLAGTDLGRSESALAPGRDCVTGASVPSLVVPLVFSLIGFLTGR
jgi:hypothetical protein